MSATSLPIPTVAPAHRTLAAVLGLIFGSAALGPVHAELLEWGTTGTGRSDKFSNPLNWTPGHAPVNGDSVRFRLTSSSGTAPVNDLSGLTLSTIEFSSLASSSFILSGNPITLTGGITNASNRSQTISIPFTLAASQTWTGGLVQTGGNLFIHEDIDLGAHALTIAGVATTNLNGTIAGSGGLIKSGSGNLNLNGTNTYTGGTTLSAGFLTVGDDAAFGDADGSLTLGGGILRTTGSFTMQRAIALTGTSTTLRTDASTTLTLSGPIGGTGGLAKDSAGTLVLSGTNEYSGNTRVLAGTLRVGAAGALSDASLVRVETAGVLDLNGHDAAVRALTGAGTVELRSGTLTVGPTGITGTAFTGSLSGSGSFVADLGAGTTLVFTGPNAHTGSTVLRSGTVQVNGDANLGGAGATLVFDGGTLLTPESFATARATTLGAAGGTIETLAGATLTHDGDIAGSGGLTKAGPGTLVLSGDNTYAGTTIVEDGTLRVDGTLAGAVSVGFGGTLDGSGTIGGLLANGTVEPGGPGSTAVMLVDGDAALGDGVPLRLDIGGLTPGTGHDQLAIAGTATLAGTLAVDLIGGFVPEIGDEVLVMRYAGRSGTFTSYLGLTWGPGRFFLPDYRADGLMLVAVPEPDTYAMLAAGLIALFGAVARSRRCATARR